MNAFLRAGFVLALVAFGAAPLAAQVRPGSIYTAAHGPIAPLGARTAARPGDLVTIVIDETQNVKNEESSDLQRKTDLSYELANFDVKPNAFSTLPKLQSASDDQFSGSANYSKKGTFMARVTAVVVDALPNGNLVVNARREIRVDQETKVIEISGVVRRFDIKSDNTIASELVANAKVSYSGEGPMTKATNRFGLGAWIHDALAWLWPF